MKERDRRETGRDRERDREREGDRERDRERQRETMAGRAARRQFLQMHDEMKNASQSSSSSSSRSSSPSHPIGNAFLALAAEDQDEDKDETSSSSSSSSSPTVPRVAPPVTEKREEDIDEILAELGVEILSGDVTRAGASPADTSPFDVDRRALDPSVELKRIFGADVAREVEQQQGGEMAENEFAGAPRRMRRLAARGRIVRQALKPGTLVKPRSSWPSFSTPGLVLRATGDTTGDGKRIYEMAISDWYEQAEEMFEQAQATYDPRNVMGLLQSHPWHGGSLLAMADLHRSTGDGAYADELVEMFMYSLERGLPPLGTLLTPPSSNAFVPFTGYNRLLFKGMMRHVQVLSRRGLHRTALECLKLLYSLNEEDPVGVLACIDFYALRAGAHAWLRSMSQSVTQASTMPNVVYSLALASALDEGEPVKGGTAEDMMLKALMIHPAAMVRMQEKLKDLDVRLSIEWGVVMTTPFFSESTARLARNPTLGKLVDIFVERSHTLWKSPCAQVCMLRAAERLVSLVNASEDMQRESLPMGLSIPEWRSVGEGAFPEGAEDASYAHLSISDFSDAVAAINPEELQALQGGDDEAEVDLMLAMAAEMGAGGRAVPDDLGDAGPFAAFLRTLLPWVNAGVAPGSGDDIDDGPENLPS